jgi:hypothetical protein
MARRLVFVLAIAMVAAPGGAAGIGETGNQGLHRPEGWPGSHAPAPVAGEHGATIGQAGQAVEQAIGIPDSVAEHLMGRIDEQLAANHPPDLALPEDAVDSESSPAAANRQAGPTGESQEQIQKRLMARIAEKPSLELPAKSPELPVSADPGAAEEGDAHVGVDPAALPGRLMGYLVTHVGNAGGSDQVGMPAAASPAAPDGPASEIDLPASEPVQRQQHLMDRIQAQHERGGMPEFLSVRMGLTSESASTEPHESSTP